MERRTQEPVLYAPNNPQPFPGRAAGEVQLLPGADGSLLGWGVQQPLSIPSLGDLLNQDRNSSPHPDTGPSGSCLPPLHFIK